MATFTISQIAAELGVSTHALRYYERAGLIRSVARGSDVAALLRRAVSLGVNLIDTADFYGPHLANQVIADALAPYPPGIVISTKVGVRRGDDASWQPAARPEEIRADVEANMTRLRLERLDVVHLRMGDGHVLARSGVPLNESLGVLTELQREGRIRCSGRSAGDYRFASAGYIGASRARVAARNIARHNPNPRHVEYRSSRGEHCSGHSPPHD